MKKHSRKYKKSTFIKKINRRTKKNYLVGGSWFSDQNKKQLRKHVDAVKTGVDAVKTKLATTLVKGINYIGATINAKDRRFTSVMFPNTQAEIRRGEITRRNIHIPKYVDDLPEEIYGPYQEYKTQYDRAFYFDILIDRDHHCEIVDLILTLFTPDERENIKLIITQIREYSKRDNNGEPGWPPTQQQSDEIKSNFPDAVKDYLKFSKERMNAEKQFKIIKQDHTYDKHEFRKDTLYTMQDIRKIFSIYTDPEERKRQIQKYVTVAVDNIENRKFFFEKYDTFFYRINDIVQLEEEIKPLQPVAAEGKDPRLYGGPDQKSQDLSPLGGPGGSRKKRKRAKKKSHSRK